MKIEYNLSLSRVRRWSELSLFRYVVFYIKEEKSITVESVGELIHLSVEDGSLWYLCVRWAWCQVRWFPQWPPESWRNGVQVDKVRQSKVIWTFSLEIRTVWFWIRASVPGDHGLIQEAETFLDVLVPWQVSPQRDFNSVKTTLHFSAKIKKKMLYSSSFDALKKSLVGVHKYIQATDSSEASEESVEKQLRSTDRV